MFAPRALCLLAAAPVLAGTVAAQGFQINEHSACAVARAGAVTAAPCPDASAIWFNPAALAGERGWTVSGGMTLIAASGGFTDDYTGTSHPLANDPIAVPHFYAAYGLNRRITLGLGAFVPYGLGTKWDTTFEGRFVGFDNSSFDIYVQPTMAIRLHDRLAVGGGIDLVVGSVGLTQRLDLADFELLPGVTFDALGIPPGTDFATAKLEASGAMGIGGHIGVWFQPTDRLQVGARYLARVPLEFRGRATFDAEPTGVVLPPQNPIALSDPTGTLDPNQPLPLDLLVLASGAFQPGQPLADSTARTRLTNPDQIAVGVAFAVLPSVTVSADWWWTHWSLFDAVAIEFDNAATPDLTLEQHYRNTSTFRVGIEWAATPSWRLRGGYLRHPPAAPDETVTPLLPEARRNSAMLGAGVKLGNGIALDVAYMYLRQDDRRGRVRTPPPGTPPATVVEQYNRGVYAFTGHLVSTTLSVRLP